MFIKIKDNCGMNVIIFLDHITMITEHDKFCKIECVDGSYTNTQSDFADIEKQIKIASGGTGHTIAL